MRTIIEEKEYVLPHILKQLTSLEEDECPLINGGCGLGKTTALLSDEVYKVLTNKLGKKPRILVTESRSLTRDQLTATNHNSNITIEQYQTTAQKLDIINDLYDIIIVDEAHSLFGDSDFAAIVTTPICHWLKNKCNIFQIYITASDEEFINYSVEYQFGKEFNLTFPNLEEAHVRYAAEKMVMSINTVKTKEVIARKAATFFKPNTRGIFFVWSAREAYELYSYYSQAGYKCGFYISKQNNSYISEIAKEEDEEDNLFGYTSTTYTISIPQAYKNMEVARTQAGMPTIAQSLQEGVMPQDLQYLFLTNVGQEGVSLNQKNYIDFIFIEDTCPMTINQKLFRYRGNVPLAYISLPQKRLEKMYQNALEKALEMSQWPQEKLEGYYLAAKEGKNIKSSYARLIWLNPENGKYEIGGNVVAQLISKSRDYRLIRDNIKDENFLREKFGVYAHEFAIEDSKEESIKEKLAELLKQYEGKFLVKEELEKITEKAKACGLKDRQGRIDFSYLFLKKYCEENNICCFNSMRKSINKKQCRGYTISF